MNTLDNKPADTRSNDAINRDGSYNEMEDQHVSTRSFRSSWNAFKLSTEDAFHRLSSDLSNLSRRGVDVTADDRTRTLEGLQLQLTNIRNSFHAFNFGIDANPNDPNAPKDSKGDDRRNLGQTAYYDSDPLGTVENYKKSDSNK